MLSKYVHRTVVFDTLRPSVSEARYYAMFNNIKNVRFMLGGIPNVSDFLKIFKQT